ncbi:hypothetical protein Y1Q_0013218 [Alligator mississippiensis]|uniref:EGF-like domain-containing protein n=1 Tax=Alligator mississippiensis TaxID=8496 RepID=A0A151NUD4_ALLMI|nr:hypothetical protein Y1Q_0013218 [Alligator mississippiensis]
MAKSSSLVTFVLLMCSIYKSWSLSFSEKFECWYKNGGCSQYCQDTTHSLHVVCSCAEGYVLGDDRKTCLQSEAIMPPPTWCPKYTASGNANWHFDFIASPACLILSNSGEMNQVRFKVLTEDGDVVDVGHCKLLTFM